jgi:hypothetical protein
MFEVKGILEFDPVDVSKKHSLQSAWKKVAMVRFPKEDETFMYYKWLLEQRFGLRIPGGNVFEWKGRLNDPVRGTHVTAINDIVEDEIYLQAKSIFNKKEVSITYDPTIIRCNTKGEKMWWHMKVYSDDIMNIRAAMGLGQPFHSLHMTIGLVNPKFIKHNEWVVSNCEKMGMYLPIR